MIATEDYQAVVGVAQEVADKYQLRVRVRHDEIIAGVGMVTVLFDKQGPAPAVWQAASGFPDACLVDVGHFRHWLEHELEPCALEVLAHV